MALSCAFVYPRASAIPRVLIARDASCAGSARTPPSVSNIEVLATLSKSSARALQTKARDASGAGAAGAVAGRGRAAVATRAARGVETTGVFGAVAGFGWGRRRASDEAA